MTRKHLRTKDGCLRCKKRKKKCDEIKPMCSACQRWGFTCIWTSSSTKLGDVAGADVSSKKSSQQIQWPVTSHGFLRFRDQTELYLLRNFDGIYQSLICPLAGYEYRNLSSFITIALDEAWSRDALNAFTGYMIYARSADKRLEESALLSYDSAVVSMKNRIHSQISEKESMSIIMTATFLGLLEGLGTGEASLGIAHFSLVAQLGQKCFSRYLWDPSWLPLIRILLEDVVYNLAVMSIFHPISDATYDAIDWMEYDRVFLSHSDEIPSYTLSPHFGGNHEIYRLILTVTRLSRSEMCREIQTHTVDMCLAELALIEARLQTYYEDAPTRAAEMYTAKYQLHVIALRIFCLKIGNKNLHPSATACMRHVRQAEQIFQQDILQENHNPALMWPLIIILCACSDWSSFEFFTQQIEQIKLNFGNGHFSQLEAVQSMLARTFEPTSGVLSHVNSPDNLRYLLRKHGILSDFDDTTAATLQLRSVVTDG